MNILFIGYWSLNDGLTQSTILPHLKILARFPEIKKVIFTSIERNVIIDPHVFENKIIVHKPIYSGNFPLNIINKIVDFIRFPNELVILCRVYKIDHIICRGAPAGSLGYLVYKRTGIPFSVESFEPHSGYMLESGTWKSWDPRYIMQKYWEGKQKKHAFMLLPVSMNYEKKLLDENISVNKVMLQPCEVNLSKFEINPVRGKKIRTKHNIDQNSIVGIYVGKFGDIYWDKEAYRIFKEIHKYFRNRFYLLIVSPSDYLSISKSLEKVNFPSKQYSIIKADFIEVPDYLNAADFAFALYRPGQNKKYLSPIKNGEYWACGLPVMIPDGIGDDSRILKETGLGVVIEDLNHPEKYFPQLEALIKADRKEEIRQLAVKYRNPEITKRAYEKLIANFSGRRG